MPSEYDNNAGKRIAVSIGPIPARLDSVKFITNRFKGGLAARTAWELAERGHRITAVAWTFTSSTDLDRLASHPNVDQVVRVRDVLEYYGWFDTHAPDYDAFVMAAAVANLMPAEPYDGKFPSHLYSAGQEFDIKFAIAPRAIDIIKKRNPRACLVGYKLFDAKSDQELIDAARHTLDDSKANLIFANTPETAKSRKLALTQDGSVIPCTFDQHVRLIDREVRQEYFRTEITPMPDELRNSHHIRTAMATVDMFERTFEKYGTVAVPIGQVRPGAFVTTSRGHTGGHVVVWDVDFKNRIVKATGKATLNAPALRAIIDNLDQDRIVVHRHFEKPRPEDNPDQYVFPGTVREAELAMYAAKTRSGPFQVNFEEPFHGYTRAVPVLPVDWNEYKNQFPSKYFGIPDAMRALIDLYQAENRPVLEIGCGRTPAIRSGYAYDPNIASLDDPDADVTLLREFGHALSLVKSWGQGLVVMCNSLNYLPPEDLKALVDAMDASGTAFIANSFADAPSASVRDDEAAVLDPGTNRISHVLRLPDDSLRVHGFYAYGYQYLEWLGFRTEDYNGNSILAARNLSQFDKLPAADPDGSHAVQGYDKDSDAYHQLARYAGPRTAWRAAWREWLPKIKNEDVLAPSAEPFDWLVIEDLETGETEVMSPC